MYKRGKRVSPPGLKAGALTRRSVEAQAPTVQMVSGRLSDTDIANAIVHAIRDVPGVLDMGQGLFAKAATYGPGKNVAGIALQHPTPGELSVEAHVVLDEHFLIKALSDVSSSSDTTPILLHFTDQIQAVVSQTLEHLGLPVPIMVDVTIDDIQAI
jgi:hypothetical protein